MFRKPWHLKYGYHGTKKSTFGGRENLTCVLSDEPESSGKITVLINTQPR